MKQACMGVRDERMRAQRLQRHTTTAGPSIFDFFFFFFPILVELILF